jgi:hypothetical protein
VPSGVNFVQLHDEEPAFLAYLATTGDVWARAGIDDPTAPAWGPGPVAEFLDRFAAKIRRYNSVHLHIGLRPDVLAPEVNAVESRGCITVDMFRSCLVGYSRGEFHPGRRFLNRSQLYFHVGAWWGEGDYRKKPEAFLRWAKKVVGWVRRHTPEQVRVYRCNYSLPATAGVAARKGLKVL